MAADRRNGSRGGRQRKNNNPEGRNQYSGLMTTARDNPLRTALAAGGVVAAGAFLWSRRGQISDQISGLSDQVNEWREAMAPRAQSASANPGEASRGGGDQRTQSEIAEEALTLKTTGEIAG